MAGALRSSETFASFPWLGGRPAPTATHPSVQAAEPLKGSLAADIERSADGGPRFTDRMGLPGGIDGQGGGHRGEVVVGKGKGEFPADVGVGASLGQRARHLIQRLAGDVERVLLVGVGNHGVKAEFTDNAAGLTSHMRHVALGRPPVKGLPKRRSHGLRM